MNVCLLNNESRLSAGCQTNSGTSIVETMSAKVLIDGAHWGKIQYTFVIRRSNESHYLEDKRL